MKKKVNISFEVSPELPDLPNIEGVEKLTDIKALYNEIPNDSYIFPSNLFGENKYNDRITKLCQFIGFTADIYNKSSRLVKMGECFCIDLIAYKGTSPDEPEEQRQRYYHKGYFAKMIKKITEELNLPIVIVNPLERMREIGEKQGWITIKEMNSLLVFSLSVKNKLFKAG